MNIKGQDTELRATIHVTRKATGKVETFELIGHSDPEKLAQLVAEARHNRKHGAQGSIVGPGSELQLPTKE